MLLDRCPSWADEAGRSSSHALSCGRTDVRVVLAPALARHSQWKGQVSWQSIACGSCLPCFRLQSPARLHDFCLRHHAAPQALGSRFCPMRSVYESI